MNRRKFLTRSVLTTASLVLGTPLLKSRNTEKPAAASPADQVGFNHLPPEPNKTSTAMKTIIHKAESRGLAEHGWLQSRHTFSFANYYNPERMHFGVLRVLNDDRVAPGMGFGTHPHQNMEIISIPLEGDLEHRDSMGNTAVIRQGDIQVMSAGTGVYHSEFNKNHDREVQFLQIWLFPERENVEPRYDQITLEEAQLQNRLHQILSPHADDAGVWIHQQAWFHLGQFEAGRGETCNIRRAGNGAYCFLLEGQARIGGQLLDRRDGIGLWDTDRFEIQAETDARVLVMEVPMQPG